MARAFFKPLLCIPVAHYSSSNLKGKNSLKRTTVCVCVCVCVRACMCVAAWACSLEALCMCWCSTHLQEKKSSLLFGKWQKLWSSLMLKLFLSPAMGESPTDGSIDRQQQMKGSLPYKTSDPYRVDSQMYFLWCPLSSEDYLKFLAIHSPILRVDVWWLKKSFCYCLQVYTKEFCI